MPTNLQQSYERNNILFEETHDTKYKIYMDLGGNLQYYKYLETYTSSSDSVDK